MELELHIQKELIQDGMCSPSLLGKDNTSCSTGREDKQQSDVNQFAF